MKVRTRWIIVAGAAVAALGIGGGIAPASGVADGDTPITGAARTQAEAAALAHTDGGTVTDTEVGDEESLYEVEVTMPDGRQIDVQLNASFAVLSSSADSTPDDSSGSDGRD